MVLVVELTTRLVDTIGGGVTGGGVVTGAVVRGGLGILEEVTGGAREDEGVLDGQPCGHDVTTIVLVVRLV
jgi:hypothetical protein